MKNPTVGAAVCLLLLIVFVSSAFGQAPSSARIDPDRAAPDIGGKPVLGSAPTVHPAIGGASVLQLIKFSGSVSDAQGVVGVTFALYADQEGGSPLWLETQNVKLDAEGRYTVLLGATSSEGLPLDIFASSEARWLSIQPQGQPEQSRILLVAVPYALKAAEADQLAGRAASDYLLTEQLESQVRETVESQVTDQLQTKSLSGGGDNTLAQVTGTGTVGQLPVFTSTGVDPTVGDSIVTQSGSNIGINATNPAVLLEMNSGGADLSPAMAFSTPNQQDFVSIFGGRLSNQNPFIAWRRGPLRFATEDSFLGLNFKELMRITPTGRVGINTTNPQVILEVNSGGADLSPAMAFTTPNEQDFVSIFGGRLTNQNPFIAWRRGPLRFATADSLLGLNFSEKMRLTSSGNLGIGTTNPQGKLHVVGQSGGLLIQNTATSPNIIGGFSGNTVPGGVVGATIGGGGSSGFINQVSSDFGTVGGGLNNTATGSRATVGGGTGNTAINDASTVAGGATNTASGVHSAIGGGSGNSANGEKGTVGGGTGNSASGFGAAVAGGANNVASGNSAFVGAGVLNVAGGERAVVPGGVLNAATGETSFAAGRRAKATHQGSFVWGDSTDADVTSTFTNQVTFRAAGGFRVLDAGNNDLFTIEPSGSTTINDTGGFALRAFTSNAGANASGVLASNSAVNGSTIGVWGRVDSASGVGGKFENTAGGDVIQGVGSASNLVFRVTGAGNVTADGTFTGGGADFAESVAVRGHHADYEPGDVLVVDPTGARRFALSEEPYSPAIAGIYSTKPGLLGRRWDSDDPRLQEEIPLAVVGMVPCKVTIEGGPIRAGDPLTTSSTPGHAMKATRSGRIVGFALGEFSGENEETTGTVEVFVYPQGWVNPAELAELRDSRSALEALKAELAAFKAQLNSSSVERASLSE